LKRGFYEVHFDETRTGQGFQPDPRKKIRAKSGQFANPARFADLRPKFILRADSTSKTGES
jgi:hypothetical protein